MKKPKFQNVTIEMNRGYDGSYKAGLVQDENVPVKKIRRKKIQPNDPLVGIIRNILDESGALDMLRFLSGR